MSPNRPHSFSFHQETNYTNVTLATWSFSRCSLEGYCNKGTNVTTKAGTFDTFKIETTFTGMNVNNPTLKNEVTSLTWYAPAIDHWVRRTFVSKANKHLQINNVIELIEYGRKQ